MSHWFQSSLKFCIYIPIVSGYVPADNIHFHQLLKGLLPKSGYFMCQGVPVESSSQMTYKTKSARFWGMPFGRVDYKDCPLWLNCSYSNWIIIGVL